MEELRQLTRKFAETELKPLIEADEQSETFRPELIKKLGVLGLTGVPVSEEFGGSGLGYQEYVGVIEELSRVWASYAISVSVTGLAQMIIQSGGTLEQKKKYLPALVDGTAIGAFALSEAGSGSDAGSLRTTAKKESDHYLINGTKLWITQGDIADTLILMARTGGAGTQGVSAFILEKGMPGFKMGKREKKMGLSASHTMEIVLENVKLPLANLIGKEGEGFKVAMNALNGGRITIGAAAVGLAKGALEVAIQHAKERTQFGKPIGDFQGVGFMLADMAAQISAAELLVQKAAKLKDEGHDFAFDASIAKLFCTDMAMKVTTDAVQVLGGSGYTREFPVERLMREAKVMQIFEGTNQIQRLIISKELAKGRSL
jgi:alkylation response protein AidB-like acyl-CoA dehydrogenase